ncbi:MAG: hypothetical protein NZ526_08495 [Aquificaceae bacterium]|nr:hypothetical protein [Aquificaceae bacterium]
MYDYDMDYIRWKGFDITFMEELSFYVDSYLLFLKDRIEVVDKEVAKEIADSFRLKNSMKFLRSK